MAHGSTGTRRLRLRPSFGIFWSSTPTRDNGSKIWQGLMHRLPSWNRLHQKRNRRDDERIRHSSLKSFLDGLVSLDVEAAWCRTAKIAATAGRSRSGPKEAIAWYRWDVR